MSIYLSMQRVRFSSPDAYEKFKLVFADTRHHLMKLPGFLHLTWWVHPDDPIDRKSTRLNSSHIQKSRMPSSA